MKYILILEEIALFVLSIFFFSFATNLPWYFYAGLFFTPDIAFLAYLVNTKIGAICFNTLHQKGLWILVAVIGFSIEIEWLFGLGIVYVGHSAFDRIFGYGLKYSDSFQHTHLGYIGNKNHT